jgi:hypothetical protein
MEQRALKRGRAENGACSINLGHPSAPLSRNLFGLRSFLNVAISLIDKLRWKCYKQIAELLVCNRNRCLFLSNP